MTAILPSQNAVGQAQSIVRSCPVSFSVNITYNAAGFEDHTANEEPRIEVRPLWPPDASCATPASAIDGKPGRKVELVVSYHASRKHLPIIQLKRVA
jgi:hypothetical protein